MNTVRFTLEFTRDVDQVLAGSARYPSAYPPHPEPTHVSVVLPGEDATFEAAVEKAEAFLPFGPTWKAPRLVSAIEGED